MSEAKHTPGPWRSVHRPNHYSGNPDLYEIHWSDDGECIAELVHGKSDACLIAAAPDLLEACEAALNSASPRRDYHPTMFAAWEKLSAAIAKAKGEA